LYRVGDKLFSHKKAIEEHLGQQEALIFSLKRTVILYDLTNTFFEGQASKNTLATFARSKEKRTDCPLVTMGLVLDGEGFPLASEIFAGNASEPKTSLVAPMLFTRGRIRSFKLENVVGHNKFKETCVLSDR
jgi:transposase